eukprot:TRINITY_DN36787_c0_g1_i1.p1 TRINITY_DN36787_c0_g1~~TRINITY_DN36787_c0_g1_i1.p1  ORF type:complete len:605 (+),score=114.72 TRINITY_DN36787_c0_g1_i1:64-1815(+)
MSVFIFVHRRPRRVIAEDACKIFYHLLALVSVTLLLVTFADWVSALGEVFDHYWASQDATLLPDFEVVLNNCSYTATVNVGREVDTTVTFESRMYVLMSAADLQNTVFGVSWTAIVISAFNKFLFRGNWWHFRWRGVILRTYIILPTIELILHIWAIVAIVQSRGPSDFASDYVSHCTSQYEARLRATNGSSSAVYVTQPFEISLTPLLVAICINFGTVIVAAILVLWDGRRKVNRDWARCEDAESHWKPHFGWEPLDEEDGADTQNQDDPNCHCVPPKRFLRKAIQQYPKEIFRGCPSEVLHGRNADGEPTVLEEVLRSASRLGLSHEIMRWMVGAPVSRPPWVPQTRGLAPPPPECPTSRVRVVRQEMQIGPDTTIPAEEVTLSVGPGGPDPEGLLRLGVLIGHSGLSHSGFMGRLVDRDERAGRSLRLESFAELERDPEGLLHLCSLLAGGGVQLGTEGGGTVAADQVVQADRSFAYARRRRGPTTELLWVPDPADGQEDAYDDPAPRHGHPDGAGSPATMSPGDQLAMSPAVYTPAGGDRDGLWPPTSADVEADDPLRVGGFPSASSGGRPVVTSDDVS